MWIKLSQPIPRAPLSCRRRRLRQKQTTLNRVLVVVAEAAVVVVVVVVYQPRKLYTAMTRYMHIYTHTYTQRICVVAARLTGPVLDDSEWDGEDGHRL